MARGTQRPAKAPGLARPGTCPAQGHSLLAHAGALQAYPWRLLLMTSADGMNADGPLVVQVVALQ